MKQNYTARLSDRKWFVLALLLTLALLWGILRYLGMAQTPIAPLDLPPVGQTDAWQLTLPDGTPVTPAPDGSLLLPNSCDTLLCTLSLEPYADRLTSSAVLALGSRTCHAAILTDGTLLADPSHVYDPASGTFAATDARPAGGIFSMGAARTLTLAVQLPGSEGTVAMLPTVTLYPELYAYQSVWLSEGAGAALPAGIFLAVSLALLLLFLFQLHGGKCNVDVLLLALAALAFCLLRTLPYGIYVVWFLQTPLVSYTLRLLPTLMLLWILWYRWEGKLRRCGWLLPLLCTAAVAAGIVWRQVDIVAGNVFTNLLQGRLLPLAMLAALLLCALEAVRGSEIYRRFFRMGGVLAALLGLAAAASFLRGGSWAVTLQATARNIPLLGWFEPLQMVNHFLLLLLFLLAFYDFVMRIARRNAEVQTLTLQNRYAAEHAEYLRRSLDDTRELRHEMRHHIEALQALCAAGQSDRVRDYVNTLGSRYFSEPLQYAAHPLINALVTACGQRAAELDAAFEASVHIPAHIDIRDTDLAVLLSNMTDNALEALAAVPDPNDRRLQLKIAVYENAGLFISCTNTFTGTLRPDEEGFYRSTKTDAGHGLGMKAMQRVAEAYNGLLSPEVSENTFHIKTYLHFPK